MAIDGQAETKDGSIPGAEQGRSGDYDAEKVSEQTPFARQIRTRQALRGATAAQTSALLTSLALHAETDRASVQQESPHADAQDDEHPPHGDTTETDSRDWRHHARAILSKTRGLGRKMLRKGDDPTDVPVQQSDSQESSTYVSDPEEALRMAREEHLERSGRKTVRNIKEQFDVYRDELLHDADVRDALDDWIMTHEVLPVIAVGIEEGTITQTQADEYVRIIREQLHDKPDESTSGIVGMGTRWDAREKHLGEIRGNIDDYTIATTLSDLPRTLGVIPDHYGILPIHEAQDKMLALLVRQEQANVLTHLSAEINGQDMPQPVKEAVNKAVEEANSVKSGDFDEDVLVNEDALKRWNVLKTTPGFNELFDDATVGQIERTVQLKAVGQLLTSKEGSNRALELGRILLHVKTADAVPFVIMNCWREPGYSGNKPFLYPYQDASQRSEVYKYIASLPDNVVAQLREQNVPGVVEIIDLVRENPTTFLTEVIHKPTGAFGEFIDAYANEHGLDREAAMAEVERGGILTTRDGSEFGAPVNSIALVLEKNGMDPTAAEEMLEREPNPVYSAIEENLARVSLHLLQEGDERQQFFVLSLLKKQEVGQSQEVYTVLNEAFLRTENEELQDEMLSVLMARSPLSPRYRGEYVPFPEKVSSGLLVRLRGSDETLPHGVRRDTEDVNFDKFHEVLNTLMERVADKESELSVDKGFFTNEYVLKALARQPEKAEGIFNLPQTTPELFDLINIGGPLFTNRETIIKDIFSNGNAEGRAKEITSIFTKKVPYWKQLYLFTETRIGHELATAASEYPIQNVPAMEQPDRDEFDFSADFSFVARPVSQMTVAEKREVADLEGTDEEVAALTEIPFARLRGEHKKIVFASMLADTISKSRNEDEKVRADQRNRASEGNLVLKPGTYIHGSAVDFLDAVLLNGNLPQEALGEGAGTDGVPFHTDFSRLHADHLAKYTTVEQALQNTITLQGGYGAGGRMGGDGQLIYLYERRETSYNGDREYSAGIEDHALVLGGYPSPELSGIILRNPAATIGQAKQSVLENGFYIPLYDMQGNLLFTSAEYDDAFEDMNLRVPVEVWDTSLKTGGKLGSNEGATFTIPTEQGPVEHYVKYATPESTAHIWTEKIADDVYRLFDIPVPNTQIVKVDGSYGHASQWLLGDHSNTDTVKSLETWNKGFLVDAFLANWDIPYAPGNNAFVSNGEVYRLDNGGALLFHATGRRKEPEIFGEEVKELEVGTDINKLGLGMRQEYPGLTDEQVREQALMFQERLTDDKIDELVDGARLSKQDRDELKDIMRLRRDYILSAVLSINTGVTF